MRTFMLVKRNIKLFFKDKGMFFTSLITPVILLVLYATFLGNVYRDNFTATLPDFLNLSESVVEGLVGGQLISSILAVSCVTVAFCSNFFDGAGQGKRYGQGFQGIPCKSRRTFAELLYSGLDFNADHLLCRSGHLPYLCGCSRLVSVACRCSSFIP